MIKYGRLVALFIGLLILMLLIVLIRNLGSGRNNNSYSISGANDDSDGLDAIKKEQKQMMARLENLERAVRGAGTSLPKPSGILDVSLVDEIAENFMTESVNRENISQKATWNATNKPNIFIVSINAEKEPNPKTAFVWTGNGILPVGSYKIEGKVVSIILQETKEEFLQQNNFINIRYLPKSGKK